MGKRLKELRGKQTQEKVANELGISRGRYSHYENEHVQPDNDLLQRIADLYNVSVDYLLGRTDDKTKVLSEGARELYKAIDLSEDDAIKKIMQSFSYKGQPITEDQARTIYFVSLGALKRD